MNIPIGKVSKYLNPARLLKQGGQVDQEFFNPEEFISYKVRWLGRWVVAMSCASYDVRRGCEYLMYRRLRLYGA